MRKFIGLGLTASIAVAASGIGARAADMAAKVPIQPSYTWTGFYGGLNAGYVDKSSSADIAIDPASGLPGLFGPALANGHIPRTLTPDMKGFIGGAQFGYNWQNGAMVYGAEVDLAYSNMRGSSSYSAADFGGYPALTTTQEQSMDWFGTLRARLGYLPTPTLLAYATGGIAVGHVKASTDIVIPTPGGCATNALCNSGSLEQTRWGWTLGGGFEYAVSGPWTVKAEYLYYDLGTATYTLYTTEPAAPGFPELQTTVKFNGHIVRVGMNRRF